MEPLLDALAVGVAGFLGSVSRWGVAVICRTVFGPRFPVGTMVINLTGTFLLGWFAAVASSRLVGQERLRLAIAVGFIGTYTTFSTWMFESHALWDQGEFLRAAMNILASVVLGLIAVRLGLYAAAGR
jgi:CrcB protein